MCASSSVERRDHDNARLDTLQVSELHEAIRTARIVQGFARGGDRQTRVTCADPVKFDISPT